MRNGRASAGHTLLEVLIASSVLALLICLLMGMLGRAMGSAEMDMAQTYAEENVQNAVDRMIDDLKETSPAKVTFYQFAEGGRPQTALVFPCARDMGGSFVYKQGGAVQPQPVWQSVKVYCYAPEPGCTWGYVRKYEDFKPRSYTNPISVTSVTSTKIILSDGTQFNRDGTEGPSQRIKPLAGQFVQLEAGLPAPGTVEEGAAFEVDPELIEQAIQDQTVRPLRLTVRSELQNRYPGLSGTTVITTLTNEVLSRNRN
jgi:type II secretory pathway pseudopilin PulG